MPRNLFINPNTGATYAWEINHTDEQETGRDRQLDFEANTGNVGLVKQQGELTPLVFRYTGTILTSAQLAAMLSWFRLCETQSIYFRDFAGDEYEVTISAFHPLRKRTLRNPRQRELLHYWSYTIELVVLKVRAGAWAGLPA